MKLIKILQGSFTVIALSTVAVISAQQEAPQLAPLQGQPVIDAVPTAPAALPPTQFDLPLSDNSSAPSRPAASEQDQKEIQPVRAAIGTGNYDLAKQKLEEVKRSNPSNPLINNYATILERRTGNQAGPSVSPLRTPRANVTPFPSNEPVESVLAAPAEVTPVPAAAVSPTDAAAIEQSYSEEKAFWETQNGKYAIGGGALLILILAGLFLKKRKGNEVFEDLDTSEPYTPVTENYNVDPLAADPAFASEFPEAEDTQSTYDPTASLSGDDSIFQLDSSPSIEPVTTLTAPTSESDSIDLTGIGGFTSFGNNEETVAETPKKPFTHFPETDEPNDTVSIAPSTPSAPPAPKEPESDTVSFEALGINFGGASEEPVKEETITPAPTPQPAATTSDSSSQDTVNIDDLLSSMFKSVETPSAPQEEETVVIPPQFSPAKTEEKSADPFASLFAGMDEKTETPPPAEPSKPAAKSLDELMAETIGLPVDAPAPAPAAEPSSNVTPLANESIDERSARMFNEQMVKARAAVEEKNWKQAVHFLSIAAALQPGDEEAQSLLKKARHEKKLSEESV